MGRKKNVLRFTPKQWEERIRAGQIFGTLGYVDYDPDKIRIICPLCGDSFKRITGGHLQCHGIESGQQFKRFMGLNRRQSLSGPAYYEWRSTFNRETASSSNLKDYQFPPGIVQGGHPGEPRRPQDRVRRQARKNNNLPPRGNVTNSANRRFVSKGSFKLFGKTYYFGRQYTGQIVTISLTDSQFTSTLTLPDGTEVSKTYQRKDLEKQTPLARLT